MPIARFQMPDGRIARFEVPEGTTPEQAQASIEAALKERAPTRGELVKREILRSPVVAVARGLKDVVDTGAYYLSALGGKDEQARVKAMNDAGKAEFDAATEGTVLPKVGRVMGNLAAVVPAVNVLGAGVATVAPRLGAAIQSGGFATGAKPAGMLAKAGDMGIRVAGGAVGGGVSAGMVNPDDVGMGAAIGGVLPPLVAGAGAVGRAVAAPFRGAEARGGQTLAKALDLQTPQQIDAAIAQLQAAKQFVPGSEPTVAQALRTPQAGILQRVVSDSAGGGALRDTLNAQNTARLAALERVAPTNPTGYATARQDLGEAVSRFAKSADKAARDKTRALYEAVPQDEAALYLPDLEPIKGRYFGPGVFTDRAAVDKAAATARSIGTDQVPAGIMPKAGQGPMTLAQAVRKAGGLSLRDNDGLRGELAGLRGDLKNLVRTNGGLTPGRMAEKMREAGYLPDEDAATLLNALRDEATGSPITSIYDDASRQWGAARDAAMGEAPAATAAPKKVSLKDFEDLRKSIGQEQRAAAQSGNNTAAQALADMKQALDDRIDEVVRGDGAIDENLPLDWADKLTQARKSKLDQVARFRTGPQEAIFRRGSDGQSVVQGGEVAAKFWGNRPGVADDVKSFRRLIDDNPQLLGQFRSMVTTEGASTQTAAGNLTSKFAKWVDSSLPGLKEAFEPDQVKLLRRIALDVKRAEAAAAVGMSRGSNTYQNAQNALNLGLLDNPLVNAAINKTPVVSLGAGAFHWAKDTAREVKARRLAELLGSSEAAAAALKAANTPAKKNALAELANRDLAPVFYRAAPVLAADR
jgi:hypothetical protein